MLSGHEPIGIIGAMDSELSLLLASMQQRSQEDLYGISFHTGILYGRQIVLVKAGIGKVNAARCTQLLIDRYHPAAIINKRHRQSQKGSVQHRQDPGRIAGKQKLNSLLDVRIYIPSILHSFHNGGKVTALRARLRQTRFPTVQFPEQFLSRLFPYSFFLLHVLRLLSADAKRRGFCVNAFSLIQKSRHFNLQRSQTARIDADRYTRLCQLLPFAGRIHCSPGIVKNAARKFFQP